MRTERVEAPVPLAVDVAGNGPLVVFVHGLGGDRTTWHAQLALLSATHTAVAVDLRGYGHSADGPDPLDFKQDFCADLVAVMDHFGVPRAHLVGLSMGGRVARATALRVPDRVASLVLAHTSPGFDALGPEDTARFIAERSSGIGTDTLPPGFGHQQALQMVAPNTAAHVLAAAAAPVQRVRPHTYRRVLEASTRQDRGDTLEHIGCPTLVVSGEHDRVYPMDVTRQLLQRIPHAQHAPIAGAGHLGHLEQPQAFHQAVLGFLNALPVETHAQHHHR